MDGSSFDRVTQAFASSSRRRALKSLGALAFGGVAGVIGLSGAGAATAARPLGSLCSKDQDCAVGTCLPKDRNGRRFCGCGSSHQLINGGCFLINNDLLDCPAGCDGTEGNISDNRLCVRGTGIACASTSECPTGSACRNYPDDHFCYAAC